MKSKAEVRVEAKRIAQEFVEDRRRRDRQLVWMRVVLWGGFAAIVAVSLYFIGTNREAFGVVTSFFGIVAVAAALSARAYVYRDFLTGYKQRIMPRLLGEYGEFFYTAKGMAINIDDLTPKGLLPHYTELDCEDIVRGSYRGVGLDLAEISARVKRNKSTDIVFAGLVVRIGMPRPFVGAIGLYPQYGGHGKLRGQQAKFPDWQRIRLESVEFEEIFEVFGTDQILGRTLLTPRKMEGWVLLANHPDRQEVRALFKDSALYLGLSHSRAWLDVAILHGDPADTEGQIDGLVDDLDLVFGAIDLLVFDEETDILN